MAPVQRTFELIPIPMGMNIPRPGDPPLPELKPPMTSKQAQRLYKQANRGPRISKAEQDRLFRAEQERIKKEFEAEKTRKRNRFLREKKKEKGFQAKEEKRRQGLPLVDVRPSQPTISWFARGPTKRKLEAVEEAEEQPTRSRQATPEEVPQQAHSPPPQPEPSPQNVQAPEPIKPPSTPAAQSLVRLALGPNGMTSEALVPTSTQYVMSHLDDFFDSPTQLDREINAEFGSSLLPTLRTEPRPPVPRFDGSISTKKSVPSAEKFTPLLPTPIPRLPDIEPVSRVVSGLKSTLPFFSSQDFLLSSQDVRDLERTTTTPSKKTAAVAVQVPPIRQKVNAEQQRPENTQALYCSLDTGLAPPEGAAPRPGSQHQETHQFKSQSRVSSPSQSKPQPPAGSPPAGTPKTIWQMALAMRPSPRDETPTTPTSPQPSLPPLPRGDQPTPTSPQPPVAVVSSGSDDKHKPPPSPPPPPPVTPPPPPAPDTSSPIRFFGSSGNGLTLLQALAESRRTHEAEERKRRAEAEAEAEAKAKAEAEAEAEAEERERGLVKETAEQHAVVFSASNDSVLNSGDGEVKNGSGSGCIEGGNVPAAGACAESDATADNKAVAEEEADKAKEEAAVSSSQETDYGDAGFDVDDFDDTLGFLESAGVSGAGTPVVGGGSGGAATPVAGPVAAGDGFGSGSGSENGDDVVKALGFRLEDLGDEWLDDDDIDF